MGRWKFIKLNAEQRRAFNVNLVALKEYVKDRQTTKDIAAPRADSIRHAMSEISIALRGANERPHSDMYYALMTEWEHWVFKMCVGVLGEDGTGIFTYDVPELQRLKSQYQNTLEHPISED